MNKWSLIAALALGWAAQIGSVAPPRAHADGKASRGSNVQARGSAARANSASPWERSYSAEAAGKVEVALSVLAELPSAQRGAYVASYRRGWLLYRLGRYAEAVAAYRTAVFQEPAAVEARVALLLPLMALTKWNDVAQAAEEVLRIDPENYLALSRLALAKFSSQRFAEAEALYRRLLILYPSDIEMRAGLGWTALRMGKQSQALGLFSQVLEVAPSHPSARLGMQQANVQNADH